MGRYLIGLSHIDIVCLEIQLQAFPARLQSRVWIGLFGQRNLHTYKRAVWNDIPMLLRRALSVEILSVAAQLYQIRFAKGSELLLYYIGFSIFLHRPYVTHHFLLGVWGDNISILYRFWDITTFTANTSVNGLEKPFNFDKTVEVLSPVRFTIHTCKHTVVSNVIFPDV